MTAILGIGTAVPDCHFTQSDSTQIAEHFFNGDKQHRRLLPILYKKTKVKRRHSVLLAASEGDLRERQSLYAPVTSTSDVGPSTAARMQYFEQHAGGLAQVASQRSLEQAGLQSDQITHLVTVSCTGLVAPGFDVDLVQSLPLNPNTPRTHVGFMGCHGAINGLRVADAFSRNDPGARVLLCSTELCSLHYQYQASAEQIVANALFADGSAAMVLGRDEDSAKAWPLLDCGTGVIRESRDMMSWRVGDHGFDMSLSAELPTLIENNLRPRIETWLSQFDLKPSDIKTWAAHPGGPRILQSFQHAMNLTRDDLAASYHVLENFGNMSSATILFLIQELQNHNAELPCVAIGFGPGITIESALFCRN
jgi:prepilin-type processing-associated H-X9-DG protein